GNKRPKWPDGSFGSGCGWRAHRSNFGDPVRLACTLRASAKKQSLSGASAGCDRGETQCSTNLGSTHEAASPHFCTVVMNLVQFALGRPFAVVVIMIATVLVALLSWRQIPKDIFPNLGIPTIYVAQPYGGMDPAQMEGYLTYYYEYHFLYVAGIEHIESK